jgi:DNA-binding transcriptional ArsR family regulator
LQGVRPGLSRRHLNPYQDITDPKLAKALAHPLRTRVLAALEGRTASPSELAEELEVPLGVLSYHVRRLTALGLLKLVKRVPRRGAVEHYYTALARPRISDDSWAAMPSVVKQATVRAALEQVGSQVSAAATAGGFDAAEAHLTRSPVTLDEQGWKALSRELGQMNERVKKIEEQSAKRLKSAGKPQGEQKATVVLMLFHSDPSDRSRGPGDRAPVSRKTRKRATAPAD